MVARKQHSFVHIALLLVIGLTLSMCGSPSPNGSQAGESPTTASEAPTVAATAAEAPTVAAPATSAPAAETPAAATEAPIANVEVDQDPHDGVIKPELIPAGMFPLTKDKVTLRVAIPGNASVEDFNTNAFTQWYEQKTNVHIEWIILPSDEALTKVNLMLASGDYPDVIMAVNISPAQMQVYGQQGIFLPLNELIESAGPNIKKAYDRYPEAWDVSTASDGNIYSLVEVNDCYHCSMAQKLWIYKPWLDKLGLKVPETTEEFYQVLKAFKEQDPNGNGLADEIPLTTSKIGDGWNNSFDAYFMNSFLLNPGTRLVLKDDKVSVTYNTPEWREGLRYLRRLAQDGLLDLNSFTQDGAQLRLLGQNDPPIIGALTWGVPSALGPIEDKEESYITQFVTVPPLKGPNGFRVQPASPYAAFWSGRFIITKAAQDPELALRWADGFYQQEVEMNAYFGPEGVGWDWAQPGDIGINGKPALYRVLNIWGNVQNDQWSQTNPSFRSSDWRLGQASDNPWEFETYLYRETAKLEPYKQDPAMAVPPLFFTQEQAQEIGQLEASLTKYVDEMLARFITGDEDVETGWDAYVQTLDQIGLPRYLEIQQAVYDAKYKK
jgi:putative aldouronate transport system substrate-binding protein